MIRKIPYTEIDFEKYRNCIQNSAQYHFFSTQEYLDILIGNHWEILVEDDYQAVMPIPFIKKLGLKFVMMPLQTQQLGIFSKEDNVFQNEAFLDFFQKHYRIYYYAFNAKNNFKTSLEQRTNFVIPKNNYALVKKNYSVHRRRNVRITEAIKDKITFHEIDSLQDSKEFFITHAVGGSKKMVNKFFQNMQKFNQAGLLRIFKLFFEGKLVSQAYLINSEKELALVNFINDKSYTKQNTASIILDQILQETIDKKDLNFHGSSIPAIADFYRRFGALEQHFACLYYSKWQILQQFFKK